jgi:lipopolysaccharide export system permease protein
MSVLNLYIGRVFISAFLAALSIIAGLIYLFDVVELQRRLSSHDHGGMGLILKMALFKLPQMIQLILPFAVMLGAMIAFWMMTRSRELIVMRSAGLSAWKFLTPVMISALLIGIVNVTTFNPLSAHLYQKFQILEELSQLRSGSPLLVSESGLWLRENHDKEHLTIHANRVKQDQANLLLMSVSIFASDQNEHFLYGIEATDGILENKSFVLNNVDILKPGQAISHQDRYIFPTKLTVDRIQDNYAPPESISFWDLPNFIHFFESSGFSANRQKLYYQSMISSPILLICMVLIAAIFSLKPDLRSGGLLVRLLGGISSGFIFYFISKVVYALGLSSTLPIILAAWAPTSITGLVGLTALFHLEDG